MKVTAKKNKQKQYRKRIIPALATLMLLLTPYFFFALEALAQSIPATPSSITNGIDPAGRNVAPDALNSVQSNSPTSIYYQSRAANQATAEQAADNQVNVNNYVTDKLRQESLTSPYGVANAENASIAQQGAEQGLDSSINDIANSMQRAGANLPGDDTYQGLHQWFSDDIVSNLFVNIGQLIGKWISEFIDGWISQTVQFLTAALRVFVLNPNIAVNGINNSSVGGVGGAGGHTDDISPYIRQGADVMYGIAVDLLLLLFILCIWKYWADAAWRGQNNLMGAVGRMIFTAGLLLAWPTIYAFEIQISNEMIKAIYFNSAEQVQMLDVAMANAVKGGLVASAGALATVFAPVMSQALGGAGGWAIANGAAGGYAGGAMVLGTIGEFVSFAGEIIFLVLGGILIGELIYIIILKAVQTALLTAQYMFAPIFIVFFATPDTENFCSGFVRSFVEVSLWSFVWVGLLKILVIIVVSDYNPWGKILIAIGILQMMIQVPGFLARAQISPMSDFVSAGLITGFALKGAGLLANRVSEIPMKWINMAYNDPYSIGAPQSQTTALNGLGSESLDPAKLESYRAEVQKGKNPNIPPTQTNQQQTPETNQQQTPPVQTPQTGVNPTTWTSTGTTTGTGTGTRTPLITRPEGAPDPTTVNPTADPTITPPVNPGLNTNPQNIHTPGTGTQTTQATQPAAWHPYNTANEFSGNNYQHVPGRDIAKAARLGDMIVGFSQDGNSALVGDGKGNVTQLRPRPGATGEEMAHLMYAAGYTGLFKQDAEGFDAARAAALAAHDDDPQTLGQAMAAGILEYNGGSWRNTGQAKQNFNRALFKHAALGSQAYVNGEQGNAYTQFLQRRYGQWTPGEDAWGMHIMTNPDEVDSTVGWDRNPSTDLLIKNGIPINNGTMGAAQNASVKQMSGWQRTKAIIGVDKIANEIFNSQHNANADPAVRKAAVGSIAKHMTQSHVDAAAAIQIESEGTESGVADDVTLGNVQAVAGLVNQGIASDATKGYQILKTVGGSVARTHNVTLNANQTGGGGGGSNYNPLSDQNVMSHANNLIMQMYNAGFNEKQMQDNYVVELATHIQGSNHPEYLPQIAIADKIGVLDKDPQNNNRLASNANYVQVIQNMVDAGNNPSRIERPQVYVAQQILQRGQLATSRNIQSVWRDPGYAPTPGGRIADDLLSSMPDYIPR